MVKKEERLVQVWERRLTLFRKRKWGRGRRIARQRKDSLSKPRRRDKAG